MRRPRPALLLALAVAGALGGARAEPAPEGIARIDSLAALPAWSPLDVEAGLPFVPHALALDPLGRVWILDRTRGRVMRLDAQGMGRSFASSGTADPGASPPADLAASGTYLFLLDPPAARVTLLDLDGYFRDRIDLAEEISNAGKPGFLASRILVGRSGDLWLLEEGGGRLLRFDRRGRFEEAPLEALPGPQRPARIADAVLSPEDELMLLDAGRARVLAVGADGVVRVEPPVSASALREPAILAVDLAGRRFILEGNGRLHVQGADGDSLYEADLRKDLGAVSPRAIVAREGWFGFTDPARGQILRWRIVSHGVEDAGR